MVYLGKRQILPATNIENVLLLWMTNQGAFMAARSFRRRGCINCACVGDLIPDSPPLLPAPAVIEGPSLDPSFADEEICTSPPIHALGRLSIAIREKLAKLRGVPIGAVASVAGKKRPSRKVTASAHRTRMLRLLGGVKDTPVPEIPLDRLQAIAVIDYIQASWVDAKPELPALAGKPLWSWVDESSTWKLTIHDPTPADVATMVKTFGVLHLTGLEVAVDFWPRPEISCNHHEELLRSTYRALAARFRPDEKLPHGAGLKGALGPDHTRPKPFYKRHPDPSEMLVYGHRDEGHNAKLYLKTTDQGVALPPADHRLRLETRLSQFGAHELGLKWPDVLGGRLRSTLAKNFCLIEGVEIRRPSRWSKAETEHLKRLLSLAWSQAGVNGFDQPNLHADASRKAREAADFRRVRLVRTTDFRFRRHREANQAIGEALRNLDRQLLRAASFPGHAEVE